MSGLLAQPFRIGAFEAPSRVVFGPHETNLGDGRAMGARHTAYYLARAAGGAGVIVTETASVTGNDWPYERAPLASLCEAAWRDLAAACERHGTVVLAGLGHSGGQGSSAYSQEVMWAPSRVADVVSREPPAELDRRGIDAIIAAFAESARLAVSCGLAGVEVDSGAWSLLRQFQSGLTNQRADEYGQDRLRFAREVLDAVRAAIGADRVLGLRMSCDELAPWAGITPEMAAASAKELAPHVDLLTVVRGGPYSTQAYRPDLHAEPSTNVALCASIREACGGQVPVVLQGSVVDPASAESALSEGAADLVEMTRAQIAEPRLVELVMRGDVGRARPCILCNQTCRVRDNRNPIVSCVGEPRSGHETTDDEAPDARFEGAADGHPGPPVLVVGAGPAGLECARVLAGAGRRVRVAERSARPGGVLAASATGPARERIASLSSWLEAECEHAGVELRCGTDVSAGDVVAARADGWEVVLATGGRPFPGRHANAAGVTVVDALSALQDDPAGLPPGEIVVDDPVGDWTGIAVAERIAGAGRSVALVTPDPVAGTLLSRTGDLADANVRLQRAGVTRLLRRRIVAIHPEAGAGGRGGSLELEDVWTAERSAVPASVLVDCGHRLPEDALYREVGDPSLARAGDCVAPRTVHEAVLEGRRAALRLLGRVAVAGGAP